MEKLALSIGGTPIQAPPQLPVGGLETTGRNLIQMGLALFILIGIIVTLIFIVYSGIQWASSGGDKTKLQAARNRLTYTIIGFIVMIMAFVVVAFVFRILGFDPSFFFNLKLD